MENFSCSDINTGWKPVIHEEPEVKEEALLPGLDTADEGDTYTSSPENIRAELSEILRLLGEIERMVISVRQQLESVAGADFKPREENTGKRMKLRRRILGI